MKRCRFAIIPLATLMVFAAAQGQPPPERTVRRQVDLLHEQLVAVEARLEQIDRELDHSKNRQRYAQDRIENSEAGNRLLNRQPAATYWSSTGGWLKAPPLARNPFKANEDAK